MLIRALHPWGVGKLRPGQAISERGFVFGRDPPDGTVATVQARHPTGDYVLPFRCRRASGQWLNDRTGAPIAADVIGWRSVMQIETQNEK